MGIQKLFILIELGISRKKLSLSMLLSHLLHTTTLISSAMTNDL